MQYLSTAGRVHSNESGRKGNYAEYYFYAQARESRATPDGTGLDTRRRGRRFAIFVCGWWGIQHGKR